MYKVFVNEKKLLLSKHPEELEKKLGYENYTTLEIALDLLENTSVQELNVYGENLDEIWQEFQKLFRIIEELEVSLIILKVRFFSSEDSANGTFLRVRWKKENPEKSLQ